MSDPRRPKENDIETFSAYAGKEEDFRVWSYRIGRDFGRGFGDAVFEEVIGVPLEEARQRHLARL